MDLTTHQSPNIQKDWRSEIPKQTHDISDTKLEIYLHMYRLGHFTIWHKKK